jgi:hypothetical protein
MDRGEDESNLGMADSFRRKLVRRGAEDEDEDIDGTSPMRAEDEAEDEDENLSDALRDDDLPDQGDDDEAEDEDEGAAAERQRGYVRATCARCGEVATVIPPKAIRIVRADSAEAEGRNVLRDKGLRWRCQNCEAANTTKLKRHRLVKVKLDESAALSFRRGYLRRLGVSDDADDPRDDEAAARFLESYAWRKACAMHPR